MEATPSKGLICLCKFLLICCWGRREARRFARRRFVNSRGMVFFRSRVSFFVPAMPLETTNSARPRTSGEILEPRPGHASEQARCGTATRPGPCPSFWENESREGRVGRRDGMSEDECGSGEGRHPEWRLRFAKQRCVRFPPLCANTRTRDDSRRRRTRARRTSRRARRGRRARALWVLGRNERSLLFFFSA